jgi:sorbitol-specific phosphotransferase system component IIC
MLYDVLPLSPGVVALLVALAAVGAFVGSEKLERIFGAKASASGETR